MTVFEHVEPDRVPMWCGALPEFWDKAKQELGLDDEDLRIRFHDDFRRVFAVYVGPEFELSPEAFCRTQFGVERGGMGYGYSLNHPLAGAGLKDIEDYSWPDPAWMEVSHICGEAEVYQGQYAMLGGEPAPFWHDLIELLGMENMYAKMYEEPELIDAVLEHVVDHYWEINRRIFEAAAEAIDIFFLANDFGSQYGPLLGPELFRRFISPQLKRLVDLGHDYGLKVMMHCCGGFAQLIPAMIEIGLDGLHAIQPSCRGMDLRKLKADFGDKMVFNGAIDSQHVLIDGTPEFVRAKTREVLDIMKPGGGYIVSASHDTILPQTPVENVLAMFDTVLEYGGYG
jgi:uroporphyrinogen decarboxylase